MPTYIATFIYCVDDVETRLDPIEFEWDTATLGDPTLHENVEGVFMATVGISIGNYSYCPIEVDSVILETFLWDHPPKNYTAAEITEIEYAGHIELALIEIKLKT